MSVDTSKQTGRAGAERPGMRNRLWLAGVAVLALVAASGCSVLDKPMRPSVYDFGPGVLASVPSAPAGALPALVLADIEAAPALDSTAVLYRLAYTNAQQLLPYAHARWSMAPAQLLRQHMRETLGQRRTVLNPSDGNVTAAQPPLMLRIDLEEFSQLFTAPGQSVGLVRLRATLVQATPAGDRVVGQRMVVAQRPASTADAPGGVRALSDASQAAVEDLEQWLSQAR